MKKKLIALAVAGALAAPVVASAQGTNVTIFGRVQAEYSLVDFAHVPSQGVINDNSRSSRWGLHITEDLGGGFKANARLEFGLNTGAGSATTPREQWVGLSSNRMGDVKFGRVQSPFKDFAGGMTIDPFAYTTLQANGAGGTMSGGANGLGSGANGFVNSAIRLDTAEFAGFSFAAIFMPGDANNIDPTNGGTGGIGGLGIKVFSLAVLAVKAIPVDATVTLTARLLPNITQSSWAWRWMYSVAIPVITRTEYRGV